MFLDKTGETRILTFIRRRRFKLILLKMELLLWKAIQKKNLQNSEEKDEAIREKEECRGKRMAIRIVTKRMWKTLY